jgi:uncharacterized OsmC-like protein
MKVVTASLKNKFQTQIYMENHEIGADEPLSAGGDDTGPNPYDLMLASLAACTAMTIRWYADRKKLDISLCEVTLEYDRIHAKDCEGCDQAEPMKRIEHVKRTVEIQGRLSDEEKEKLLSIPGKCPVSRTLKNGIVIEDEVKYT